MESSAFLAPDEFSFVSWKDRRMRWMRIAHGKYAGDLAWSDPQSTSAEWVLWLVPRLRISPAKKNGPIPAQTLSFDTLEKMGQKPVYQADGLYTCRGQIFRDGLMQYRVSPDNVQYPLVITRDEVLVFRNSSIPEQDRNLIIRRCSDFDFEVDMRVLVHAGEQQGLIGFIKSLTEDFATLRISQSGHSHEVSIPLQQLQRVWNLGDNVRVRGGAAVGTEGRVIAVSDSKDKVQFAHLTSSSQTYRVTPGICHNTYRTAAGFA